MIIQFKLLLRHSTGMRSYLISTEFKELSYGIANELEANDILDIWLGYNGENPLMGEKFY